jgi:hypothetical protein
MSLSHGWLHYASSYLLTLAACGPRSQDGESGTDQFSSSSTGDIASGTSGGEPDSDLSWLVGKYTSSCLPYPESPYVHGCKTDRSYELEFLPDGKMSSKTVFCAMSATQVEVGVYQPGATSGEAIIEPGEGFDHVYITGPTPEAVVRKTDDCMVMEITTGSAGLLNTTYFVRGEFEYVPEAQGCSAEVVATAVPECP